MLTLLLVVAGCSGTGHTAADLEQEGWITLFDGTSLDGWTQVGPGGFELETGGSAVSRGGMGLFYYSALPFRDFILELDWRAETDSANSGIFVRFPLPSTPWDAVNKGYEIQILDRGDPMHRTGAVYSYASSFRTASRPAGEWNRYRIEVFGQRYQVFLNGVKVNDFVGSRSREGFIGLQNHDYVSRISFRNVRVRPIEDAETIPPESLADVFAVDESVASIRVLMLTATHGYRHGPAIEAAKKTMAELSKTTEFDFDFTEDLSRLHPDSLAEYDVIFLANTTLRGGEVVADVEPEPVEIESMLWRAYSLELTTPDGAMGAFARLDGDPSSLSGRMSFDGFPEVVLQDVQLDDDTLTFGFDGGAQYGYITGSAALVNDRWDGVLIVAGNPVPINGGRIPETGLMGGDEDRDSLPSVSRQQRTALIDFLRAGKGIVAAHAAIDAFQPWDPLRGRREGFFKWDEYREMLGGGLFESHPWTQSVRIKIEQKTNGTVSHLGDAFWIRDEIYVLDENPRAKSLVLASLDTSSVEVPDDLVRTRSDFPISWIHSHEGGRVFVTKLGHFPDVWRTPDFIQHVLQGMRIVSERLPSDFSVGEAD